MTFGTRKHPVSVEQALALFPEFTAEQIRAVLDRACRRRLGEQTLEHDPVADLIARAQSNSGLSEEEAMELAGAVTREVRAEKVRGKR